MSDNCVLVVEDEPMIRMLAADMLDVLGLGVVEAADGGEAIALTSEGISFQVAMIDLGLPDRPGEEVLGEIRRMRPTLPIIVTTGRAEQDMDSRTRGEGIVFLAKPYQLADLERALQALKLAV